MTSSRIYGRPSDLPLPPDDPARELAHVRLDDPALEHMFRCDVRNQTASSAAGADHRCLSKRPSAKFV